MKKTLTKRDGFTVIKLSGEMEPYDAEAFEEDLVKIIDKGVCKIVIDLGELEYISSIGLSALLNIKRRLQEADGTLSLSALNGKVLDVFRISKLVEIFQIYETTEEAIK